MTALLRSGHPDVQGLCLALGGLVWRVAAVASQRTFGHCYATGSPRSFVWRGLGVTAKAEEVAACVS
jgi:hypothetical protein